MKIRSVTCFYDPGAAHAPAALKRLSNLARTAVDRFAAAGFEVQTTRLALPPFPRLIPGCCDDSAVIFVQQMEKNAAELGFSYISFGPAVPEEPHAYEVIPRLLSATRNSFFGGILGDARRGISLPAVRACGEVIAAAAPIEEGGFANLRFAALANVPAYAPFFPAAYHTPGDPPAFALALEAAGLAQDALRGAATLNEARERLLNALESHAVRLEQVARSLGEEFNTIFRGLDFSLAPFPTPEVSLGGAMELLGLPSVGLSGSLAASAFLAETLDRGNWLKVGFNGMMMPVLEDSGLAQRAAEGTLGIQELLTYSAVCGTGLDTVPLPGDATPQQLSAVLLDVAALAVRLNKPLTARLMPIPGKAAGEPTAFSFDFFANSRVMRLPAAPLFGLFAGSETFDLHPRVSPPHD